MRILIVNDTYYPNKNGSSYFTQRLAYYLQKKGHDVLVIAPSKTIHQGYFVHNGVRIYGIRSVSVFVYKNFRVAPTLFAKRTVMRVIKKFKPDVVHMQGHFLVCSTVLSVAKNLDIPVVGTNHFMPDNLTPYLHLPNKVDNIIHKIAWMHFRHVFHKFDFATTPTKSAGNIIKDIGFKKEVRAISCGIDFEVFNPENDGSYLKKRYHLPNKKILLYVGRLDKEKNIDWVIEALPEILKKADIHFVIVGGGTQRAYLQNLVLSKGLEKKVTFTGIISDKDLPKIYTVADCFVMAGTAELQSLVTMEAMASGLPIVAANACALPELVSDGENGYLFEPGDIKKLAKSIISIMTNSDLHKQMVKRSLELIRKHDINKSIQEFEDIYMLLKKKK